MAKHVDSWCIALASVVFCLCYYDAAHLSDDIVEASKSGPYTDLASSEMLVLSSCVIPLYTSVAGDLLDKPSRYIVDEAEYSLSGRSHSSRGALMGALYGAAKVNELREMGMEEEVSHRIIESAPHVISMLGGNPDGFLEMLKECQPEKFEEDVDSELLSGDRSKLFGLSSYFAVPTALRRLRGVLRSQYGISVEELMSSGGEETYDRKLQDLAELQFDSLSYDELNAALDALLEEEGFEDFGDMIEDELLIGLGNDNTKADETIDVLESLAAEASETVETVQEDSKGKAYDGRFGLEPALFNEEAIQAAVQAALEGNHKGVENALAGGKSEGTLDGLPVLHGIHPAGYPMGFAQGYLPFQGRHAAMAGIGTYSPSSFPMMGFAAPPTGVRGQALSYPSFTPGAGLLSGVTGATAGLRGSGSLIGAGLAGATRNAGILGNAMATVGAVGLTSLGNVLQQGGTLAARSVSPRGPLTSLGSLGMGGVSGGVFSH